MQRRDLDDSIRRHPSSLAPPERHRRFGPWGVFASVLSALGIVVGVIVVFVAVGAGGSGQQGGAVGAQAPEFDLTTLDGRDDVRLSTYRGRVVVITFERPSCGRCFRSEMALDAAWRRFRRHGVAVMGIRRDTTAVVAAVGSTPGPWPVLADPRGDTADAYGVQDAMETFVIDGDGKVVAALDGPVTESALSAQLAAVLHVPDPEVASPGTVPATTGTQEPATTPTPEPPTTGAQGVPTTVAEESPATT
jgi:peroxiredoxin